MLDEIMDLYDEIGYGKIRWEIVERTMVEYDGLSMRVGAGERKAKIDGLRRSKYEVEQG